ncbi:hypothetical protein A2Y99_01320 [Candidatus Gottesmanbacteria bacterium RBG_13_37_7]|uniref:CBS domain-containing protein n=1 Tax=Candidatus Gottesmanbacteria bacterium RBG_13_37_7 TaxID=1798369 RepID=A0A1F5YHM8_9BACT|nr:MAG: hypothetical protein A2Y99_01320 [Candidatus Gottesmanbacteria bacterium RBG_13_37_7]
MYVKQLMRKKLKTVQLDTPINEVWNLISSEQLHLVPVLDKKKTLKGLITAEDLLINLIPDYREFFSEYYPISPTIEDVEKKLTKQLALCAKDVMNKRVFTIYHFQDVFNALSKMIAHNLRILPVINENEVVMGFIVEKDIFKYLFKKKKNLLKELKKFKSQQKKVL